MSEIAQGAIGARQPNLWIKAFSTLKELGKGTKTNKGKSMVFYHTPTLTPRKTNLPPIFFTKVFHKVVFK